MIKLFLNNINIDLTEDVSFPITREFEELSNPTILINDWSKTISIPFTQHNNKAFGHIYNVDRVVVDAGTGKTMEIYFDPTQKMDMRLEWNNDVIMMGYAKMNQIKQVNGKGTYEITLFGQLGKLFQQMKNITFDQTTDNTEYIIDGSLYVDEVIDKDLVYQSWMSGGQDTMVLKHKGESGYHVTDIIGFAPNNSFSDEFDYKTFQYGNEGRLFTDVLGTGFTTDTGVKPDTAIPNGLLPREIGEYRSYHQLPFIYWNKLWQIFTEKAEEVTGYNVELDDTWFNESNPYWFDLVYMLKSFDAKKIVTYPITNLNVPTRTEQNHNMVGVTYTYIPKSSVAAEMPYEPSSDNDIYDAMTGIFTLPDKRGISLNGNVKVTYNVKTRNGDLLPNAAKWGLDKTAGIVIEFDFMDGNTLLKSYKFAALTTDTTIDRTQFVNTMDLGQDSQFDFTVKEECTLNIPYSIHATQNEIGSNTFSIQVKTYMVKNPPVPDYVNSDAPTLLFWVYGDEETWGTLDVDNYIVKTSFESSQLESFTEFRSGSEFTLNDLWDNERNPLTEILNYCRIFRIIPYVDYYTKTLHFEAASNYFKRSREKDWTNKLDKSQDYIIKPVTFENKYVLFNYADNNTKLGKEYKEKYGVNYCDYRLITDYQFNTDTQNLFKDKITPSIVNTDNVLSWTNLYDNHRIVYSFPAETYVYNKDKDKKQVDIFGSFFFHNGVADFSTEPELYMRPVRLSDDTTYQKSINTYFYTQNAGELQPVTTYPSLNIVRTGNMCTFNTPKENYTYNNNYENKQTIYSNFWERYLNERYNPQNKLVTCYVKLTPMDFRDFQFYDIIKIGNQRYLVNKIYDYDLSSNGLTKVDLITIQDFNNYTLADFPIDYIRTAPQSLTIPYDYYKMVKVTSSGDWEVRSDDHRDFLVVIPEEGHSGETEVLIGSVNEEGGYTLHFDLLDDESVIASTSLPCSVGGTSTLTVSQWYNNITVGGSTTVNITSDSNWHIMDDWSGGDANVTLIPTSGTSGVTNMLIRSDSGTGVNDYYMENESGDIASIRVHVTE